MIRFKLSWIPFHNGIQHWNESYVFVYRLILNPLHWTKNIKFPNINNRDSNSNRDGDVGSFQLKTDWYEMTAFIHSKWNKIAVSVQQFFFFRFRFHDSDLIVLNFNKIKFSNDDFFYSSSEWCLMTVDKQYLLNETSVIIGSEAKRNNL